MDPSETPEADRPYSGGFIGLFGARGSFTRHFARGLFTPRFERARRRARPLRCHLRGALPAGLSIFYVLSHFFGGAALRRPHFFRADAWLWWLAVPAVMLVGACLAGARAFAGERERGTAEALVLTPLSRQELVAGRFLAHLRPYFGFALLFAFVTLLLVPFPPRNRWSHNHGGYLTALGIGLTYCFFYFSLMATGAALGLWAGVRMRSSWGAGAAAVACLLAAAGAGIALLAGMLLFLAPLTAFGSLAFAAGVNLLLASSIVQWTVRGFDRLAVGEP